MKQSLSERGKAELSNDANQMTIASLQASRRAVVVDVIYQSASRTSHRAPVNEWGSRNSRLINLRDPRETKREASRSLPGAPVDKWSSSNSRLIQLRGLA